MLILRVVSVRPTFFLWPPLPCLLLVYGPASFREALLPSPSISLKTHLGLSQERDSIRRSFRTAAALPRLLFLSACYHWELGFVYALICLLIHRLASPQHVNSMRGGPCHSLGTVPSRSGTVPGTDCTLDVQVPSERITGVVPKNRLEVFFKIYTCGLCP